MTPELHKTLVSLRDHGPVSHGGMLPQSHRAIAASRLAYMGLVKTAKLGNGILQYSINEAGLTALGGETA